MKSRTVIVAEDSEDLEILSARLQDAVARVKDLVWLPNSRRFAALFHRFKWEEAEATGESLRVRTVLSFENVVSAKVHNVSVEQPEAVLSLLAIQFSPNEAEDP